MKTELVVSVIIPTYNNGRFIERALKSIFQQTYPLVSIEIIVVDDGSTDNTYEVIEPYLDRIIYIYQENKGIASARNSGVSIAKGEIIAFLDSDDKWHEDKIQRVVNKFIENPDTGLVYHTISLIDDNGAIIYKDFYDACGYKGVSGWITNNILSGEIFCGGSSFAFKKNIVDKACPVPEGIRRGIDYYMTAISSCYAKAIYIPEVLGRYRVHEDNTTMARGENDRRELAEVNRDFAFMRQMVIDKISNIRNPDNRAIDLSRIRRIQAKELIFYNVLRGRRFDGIRCIPSLFSGKISAKDMVKIAVLILMVFFVPAFFYPRLVKIYGFLRRYGNF